MSYISLVLCLFVLPSIFCDCPKVKVAPRVDGYFWRDYHGDIPEDALKAGSDAKGKDLYIGQTLKEQPYGAIIVGHIDPVEKKLYYGYEGNPSEVTHNVKILCSSYPERFRWIKSDFSKIRSLYLTNMVVGGYDTYPLFIGRKELEHGGVVVGKLTLNPEWESFAYVLNMKAIFEKTEFEVLTYKSQTDVDEKVKSDCSRSVHINLFY